ncbi:hypothetical protein ACLOJK_024690 [Asimina triloba]
MPTWGSGGLLRGTRKGPWMHDEDIRLVKFVTLLGDRRWDYLAVASGLNRSGKSCRMRWLNYLRPDLKRGRISSEEEDIILQLHALWGNKWSKIARHLPGRTDNEIKNYWRTHLRKKSQEGKMPRETECMGQSHSTQENQRLLNNTTESSSEDRQSIGDEDMHQSMNEAIDKVRLLLDHDPFAISPFEAGLSGWLTEMVNDTKSLGCSISESGFCFPGNADATWDYCLGSLWDAGDQRYESSSSCLQ